MTNEWSEDTRDIKRIEVVCTGCNKKSDCIKYVKAAEQGEKMHLTIK